MYTYADGMARPRKPTRVLELSGAFRHDPQRRAAREGEPVLTEPLGEAPGVLDEAETARWEEIRRWAPWLTVADRVIVEETCRLWMAARNNELRTGDRHQLAANLGRLGMTPSDRSRVKAPGSAPPVPNPFDALKASAT
jgi:hypothetical protein